MELKALTCNHMTVNHIEKESRTLHIKSSLMCTKPIISTICFLSFSKVSYNYCFVITLSSK